MKILNANDFKGMIESGFANLYNNAEEINKLNVFPVPDGDTGTNMSLTVENGLKEVLKCESDSVYDLSKAFSKGLLMGARGNSGVITSQIFRGFSMSIEGKKELTPIEIADAFVNGAKVAYRAIMKPVEGTILTVVREGAWYARHDFEVYTELTVEEYFSKLAQYSLDSLNNTPELLPILKEVGVVDSGGAGLLKILEGFKSYMDGKPIASQIKKEETVDYAPALDIDSEEFGYCTEFILRLDKKYRNGFDENVLKKNLDKIGGVSLVVVKDEDLVKVHVHMKKPGEALNLAQRYGEFIKLKIENMEEQHSALIANAKEEKKEETETLPEKEYGIIAVGSGEGITKLLKTCGSDIVVSGGQTMNPSCEDFIREAKKLANCHHILIFPNNSNIILASKQAKEVLNELPIEVIETKSVPVCISCLSAFDKEGSFEENRSLMESIISSFLNASVTLASKDTMIEGRSVKEGDTICMCGHQIVSNNVNRMEAVYGLLRELLKEEEKEIITIFVGEDGNTEEAEEMKRYITAHSVLDVEIFPGGQPVYSYLLGIE